MKRTILTLASLFAAASLWAQEIELQWVGQAPQTPAGQSWGVPFLPGEVVDGNRFELKSADGESLPLQSWVMARHKDGSVKWLGLATSVDPGKSEMSLSVLPKLTKKQAREAAKKAAAQPVKGIAASETENTIVVNNGIEEITFAKSGASLIQSITIDGVPVATDGKLVASLE
ncbi:MAG: hypothetical protein II205_00825, partial [Bacteroidales bacterium]|nr:hypothetical protein [Bacteroidales bacterium]